ncbi:MAG: hypothetical protein ACYC7D_05165 [Nitrososphaerales archaeon]
MPQSNLARLDKAAKELVDLRSKIYSNLHTENFVGSQEEFNEKIRWPIHPLTDKRTRLDYLATSGTF